MHRVAVLTAAACLVTFAGVAHAQPVGLAESKGEQEPESRWIFPLQVDLDVEFVTGGGVITSNVYFAASYVRTFKRLDNGWLVFGGVGFVDDFIASWSRSGRREPDAISGFHMPGAEARFGLIRSTKFGAPRFVAKVAPLYALGVSDMDLPGDRGFGVRASAGITWPAWLLGRIEPDPPGTRSDEQTDWLKWTFAAFIPSEIEYVFQYVPGDTRHGVAFGWSF